MYSKPLPTPIPDAPALIHGSTRRSWPELDQRADGLAKYLMDAGCARQDKVAFYLYNRPEYLELFLACSKASLVHVNTNYRYADDELVYIWENADSVAVVFQGMFTETANRVRDRASSVRIWLWVDDGTSPCPEWAVPFETAAATPSAGRVRCAEGRDGDDLVFLYTGGTTGMPKGVMWRQDDLLMATDRTNRHALPHDTDFDADGYSAAVRARTTKPGPLSLPACPLMHGTGLFNGLNTLALGGSIVTLEDTHFKVEEFLDVIQNEGVKSTFIVGDAFAKPILRALDEQPDRWDISPLRVIISSGVMWSSETKQGLLRHHPDLILVDAFGRARPSAWDRRCLPATPRPRRPPSRSAPSRWWSPRTGAWSSRVRASSVGSASGGARPWATTRIRSSRLRPSRSSTASATRCPATSPPSRPTGPSRSSVEDRSASTAAARRSSPKKSRRF